MTVNELVKKLSKHPGDMLVCVDVDNNEHGVFNVNLAEADEDNLAAVVIIAE